jgi:hypothetical protein
VGTTGISWREVKDAEKYPRVHRRAPQERITWLLCLRHQGRGSTRTPSLTHLAPSAGGRAAVLGPSLMVSSSSRLERFPTLGSQGRGPKGQGQKLQGLLGSGLWIPKSVSPSHSVDQSKSQDQPRLQALENQSHLCWGGTAKSHCEGGRHWDSRSLAIEQYTTECLGRHSIAQGQLYSSRPHSMSPGLQCEYHLLEMRIPSSHPIT